MLLYVVLALIKSSHEKEIRALYSLSGPGADQPPVGLFTIDQVTGDLSVTGSLDRENQSIYTLHVHAVTETGSQVDKPTQLLIRVIDQNDNQPVFKQPVFQGGVSEASEVGFEFMQVVATDADEQGNIHSDIRYKILSQDPPLPSGDMFFINPVTGAISVNAAGLDREQLTKYTLVISAADLEGRGLAASCEAKITVTDSNDQAPEFEKKYYTASVSENVVGASVVTVQAADKDAPNTPAWTTSYKIVAGDDQGMFNVTTGPNKLDGIITTVKPLNFEKQREHHLLVTVENDIPFSTPLPTSTATVTVRVKDENDAPVFQPGRKIISRPEDLPTGSEVVMYNATDPDTERNQTVSYKIRSDPAGWLQMNRQTGRVTVRSSMDRESAFVQDGKYTALILAVDDDEVPATGTGTLVIELEDVNDHPPTIRKTSIAVCNQDPEPAVLPVLDRDGDGPGLSAPFRVKLMDTEQDHWTADMNSAGTLAVLKLSPTSLQRDFNIKLRVCDSGGLCNNNTILAHVNEENCITRGTFCIRP